MCVICCLCLGHRMTFVKRVVTSVSAAADARQQGKYMWGLLRVCVCVCICDCVTTPRHE